VGVGTSAPASAFGCGCGHLCASLAAAKRGVALVMNQKEGKPCMFFKKTLLCYGTLICFFWLLEDPVL
jgi:hypothetical protein